MFDRTTDAKTFTTAACALAIALFTIGTGVDSSWAGSEQPSGLKYTPILFGGVFPPVPSAGHPLRSITMPRTAVRLFISTTLKTFVAQNCLPAGSPCSNVAQCCFNFTCSVVPPASSTGAIPLTAICQPSNVPECENDTDCTFPFRCIDNPNPADLENLSPLRYCVR